MIFKLSYIFFYDLSFEESSGEMYDFTINMYTDLKSVDGIFLYNDIHDDL